MNLKRKMNLKRLWCLLVIMTFSSPVFAVPVVPGQIDSFDDIGVGGTNWVEATGGWNGTYMEQVLVGAPNEVYEGTGSMKIDYTLYSSPGKRDEIFRTFSPVLDLTNYEELAITLWVWIGDPNDTRRRDRYGNLSIDSRLDEIVLIDATFDEYLSDEYPYPWYEGPLGRFTVQPVKNVGWNKVIAPLRNFIWTVDPSGLEGSKIEPNEVLWSNIEQIALFTKTPPSGDHNAIYIDDMQFELAPPPSMPYQVTSCDDIWDELWEETHGTTYMTQNPPGDTNVIEGSGSMMINFIENGGAYDLTPRITLIPALDFTDGNDWSISIWVWSDFIGVYGDLKNDSYLWEIQLHDAGGNRGNYRVPRQDLDASPGWAKVTARIDEFIWENGFGPGSFGNITAAQANLEAIVDIELWVMDFPNGGNNIYLDDLRIESAVKALSEAVVYNADYGTITVDGDASDWAGLVDSDIIDFDLTDPSIKGRPIGDLHVKYRLAWDPNYLYILVEEQPGDDIATEASSRNDLISGGTNIGGSKYDSLGLSFDFTNSKLPSVDVHMALYLILGLSSTGQTDLMVTAGNPRGPATRWSDYSPLRTNGSVATSGTLGSRVIEAKLKWTDLDDGAIHSWFKPAGGFAAAVKPGYIFGCDPKLQDKENDNSPYDASHGMGWFSGASNPIGWAQGNFRWPTGRDKYSTDIRLVCSAGDLDFDCDVDFFDFARLAKELYNTDCNNVNDFCDGADIVITGEVDLEDVGKFVLRWLEGTL